jgi:ATPase subunit of ABC transporter with duplicated ATPase domains
MVHNNVRVGYYSQDFATLDPTMAVRDSLEAAAINALDQDIYRVASQFMLTGDLLKNTI